MVLKRDVTTLSVRLFKNDRLEPTADFPDIHKIFEVASPFKPFTILFWRTLEVTAVLHRNPILLPDLGISYMQFSVDVLHCLHLGVFLYYLTKALHMIFKVDGFEHRQTRKTEKLIANAIALKARLAIWYPLYDKVLAGRGRPPATRINHLTETMLGAEDLSSLVSLKAAEARHLLPFVLEQLQKFKSKLSSVIHIDNFIRAGQCLEDFMQILNSQPRKMQPSACQSLVDLVLEHNARAQRAGVKMYPKHHQERLFCFVNQLKF